MTGKRLITPARLPGQRRLEGRGCPKKTSQSAIWGRLVIIALLLQPQLVLAATCTSKARENIVIALDVGHNARRPGEQCQRFTTCPWGETSARGVPEYDFNIKLAQRIKEGLVGAGFQSTSLIVTTEEGIRGLHQRANRANSMNADLFFSIHHDGVRDEYLKQWLYKDEPQFFFDEAKGFSLHVSPRYAESLSLARILADELMGIGLHFTTLHEPSNPAGARVPFLDSARGIYLRDKLAVLNNTEMPAVLLEAGLIVNRDEELVVSTAAYQEKIATAVAEAVQKFCSRLHLQDNQHGAR